jgi:hypothetical protein
MERAWRSFAPFAVYAAGRAVVHANGLSIPQLHSVLHAVTVYCCRTYHVVRCILCAAYRVLYAICCMLYPACCMPYAACCTYVVCCMLYPACCMLHAVRCMVHVCRMLHVACCMLHAACCMLRVACWALHAVARCVLSCCMHSLCCVRCDAVDAPRPLQRRHAPRTGSDECRPESLTSVEGCSPQAHPTTQPNKCACTARTDAPTYPRTDALNHCAELQRRVRGRLLQRSTRCCNAAHDLATLQSCSDGCVRSAPTGAMTSYTASASSGAI